MTPLPFPVVTHIVVVRWLDSRGASPGWQHVSELTDGPCEMVSVGRLVLDDGDHVVIAPHFSTEDDEADEQVCGAMYIPRAAIVQMDALALPEAKVAHPKPPVIVRREETAIGPTLTVFCACPTHPLELGVLETALIDPDFRLIQVRPCGRCGVDVRDRMLQAMKERKR